jgi:pimeloyl-ACP methyl ester carboxylesterase
VCAVNLLLILLLGMQSGTTNSDCVVLLHGMVRTSASMNTMASALESAGYRVVNIDYPSRQHPIETLAPLAVEKGVQACGDGATIHFVTHSLGGILVRYYLERQQIEQLGRVVMLAPPNQGSEVVDRLRNVPGFGFINGPAGRQLGTGKDSLPLALGAVDYEVGVIAGTSSINLILSQWLPSPNDGKVSTANTRVEGMTDFITVPHSHPLIMNSRLVIQQTLSFLKTGAFSKQEDD